MPELPEVNTFQNYFNETALQQKIESVDVHDDKIIRNCSGDEFADKLAGRTFVSSYRRGKYLFGKLDNDHHVLLHFGMTGDIKYYTDHEDAPRHERFAFRFANGLSLGFKDTRKFAHIRYLEDLEAYIAQVGLGEDALLVNEKTLLQKMEGRKTTIKGFLLNQKMLAGVGNLYADEILYQLRIHPGSIVKALSQKQRKAIIKKMKEILHLAIERAATYQQSDENWLWNIWREENKQVSKKGIVKRTKIAGRTTFFIENWQKKYV